MIETDVIEKLTERRLWRLEREIEGAWRAGYDYMHYCVNMDPVPDLSHKAIYHPSDLREPPVPDRPLNSWTVRTYDLRFLVTEDVIEVLGY